MEAPLQEEQEPEQTPAAPVVSRPGISAPKHLFLTLQALTRELGHRPTIGDYRELRERDPGLPGFAELRHGYGSWNATLAQAGLATDDENSIWREILLGEGKNLQVDVSTTAILDMAEQVQFLEEAAAEQGIDLWAGVEWIATVPDEDETNRAT